MKIGNPPSLDASFQVHARKPILLGREIPEARNREGTEGGLESPQFTSPSVGRARRYTAVVAG